MNPRASHLGWALAASLLVAGVWCAGQRRMRLPTAAEALPGRATPMALPEPHGVFGTPLRATPAGMGVAVFGMGCFWGAERVFFSLPGVVSTATGYAGGATPNPTYDEVCTGRTGHAEVVRVVFDPARVSYEALLRAFWENHDPTQGMRQGNDLGTQYRSAIYASDDAQLRAARASRDAYAAALRRAGRGAVTTEVRAGATFYFAEPYHQQYCARNPAGYCHHDGTGVAAP
ncbi:MAG: peptide-methionine (S)-S-oxide reductase MsrA [Polyangiales bacterium]